MVSRYVYVVGGIIVVVCALSAVVLCEKEGEKLGIEDTKRVIEEYDHTEESDVEEEEDYEELSHVVQDECNSQCEGQHIG